MAVWLKYLIIALAGYLLGNVSVGILISRLYGIRDIRKVGSGNAGTTNVLRNLGWVPSVMTLLGDCLKGLLAALIGKWLAGDVGLIVGGTCAVIGHDYPVFFKFKGGKGIATNLGMIIVLNPLLALILLVAVLAVVAVSRYMSLGSIMACFLYPALVTLMMRSGDHFTAYLLAAIFNGALAFWRHRANLMRLIHGEENRLDFKKISSLKSKIQKHSK